MATSTMFHARRHDTTLIVTPMGNVSSLAGNAVHPEIEKLLDHLKNHEVKHVVFDFDQVEYFGSVMLAAMSAVWKRVRRSGGKLVLCRVSPVSREILSVARFDTLWPIYATPLDAVSALAAGDETQ